LPAAASTPRRGCVLGMRTASLHDVTKMRCAQESLTDRGLMTRGAVETRVWWEGDSRSVGGQIDGEQKIRTPFSVCK